MGREYWGTTGFTPPPPPTPRIACQNTLKTPELLSARSNCFLLHPSCPPPPPLHRPFLESCALHIMLTSKKKKEKTWSGKSILNEKKMFQSGPPCGSVCPLTFCCVFDLSPLLLPVSFFFVDFFFGGLPFEEIPHFYNPKCVSHDR